MRTFNPSLIAKVAQEIEEKPVLQALREETKFEAIDQVELAGENDKVNDVRVRRVDSKNVVVEQCRAILRQGTNEKYLAWKNAGYYTNVRNAALGAISLGAVGDNGSELIACIDRNSKLIIESLDKLGYMKVEAEVDEPKTQVDAMGEVVEVKRGRGRPKKL